MKRLVSLAALALAASFASASAQTTVKIGVLSDMSSLYADIGGPNSVVATAEVIISSGPEAEQAVVDRTRTQLRMVLIGALNWRSQLP